MGFGGYRNRELPSMANLPLNGALLAPSNNGKLKGLYRLFKGDSVRKAFCPLKIAPYLARIAALSANTR